MSFKTGAVIVTIIFVIAKVTGNLDWSWWLVSVPAWGYILLMLILLILKSFLVAIIRAIHRKTDEEEDEDVEEYTKQEIIIEPGTKREERVEILNWDQQSDGTIILKVKRNQ